VEAGWKVVGSGFEVDGWGSIEIGGVGGSGSFEIFAREGWQDGKFLRE
jgi:hypothetical protein